jgi:hypothetical protein
VVQRRVLAVADGEIVQLHRSRSIHALGARHGAPSKLTHHTANQSRASNGSVKAMRRHTDMAKTLLDAGRSVWGGGLKKFIKENATVADNATRSRQIITQLSCTNCVSARFTDAEDQTQRMYGPL